MIRPNGSKAPEFHALRVGVPSAAGDFARLDARRAYVCAWGGADDGAPAGCWDSSSAWYADGSARYCGQAGPLPQTSQLAATVRSLHASSY